MASPLEKSSQLTTKRWVQNCSANRRTCPLSPSVWRAFSPLAAYGIYRLKYRGETKMSIHLIHTRMAAQGFVVGSIVCGVVYTMIRDYVWKPQLKSSENR